MWAQDIYQGSANAMPPDESIRWRGSFIEIEPTMIDGWQMNGDVSDEARNG